MLADLGNALTFPEPSQNSGAVLAPPYVIGVAATQKKYGSSQAAFASILSSGCNDPKSIGPHRVRHTGCRWPSLSISRKALVRETER
jgi:hypothetical protein